MTNDLTFNTNSHFDSVTYYEDTDSWCFAFSENISISFTGFWRLFKTNKIVFVSSDNGHQFGLPEPIELVSELTRELNSKTLIEIKADKDTADLTLIISNEIRIEFYTSSAGYENYYLAIKDKTYIGMGGGNIEVVVPTENPHILKSIPLK